MPKDRKNPRGPTKIDLSHHLVLAEGRIPIRCLGVDVSRNGVGIVGFEKLEPTTKLLLVTKERGIALEVIRCKQDGVKSNVFHLELECKDPAINVIKLLETEGLLDVPIQQPAINFDSVRKEIAILHSYDQSILRKIGLESLAQVYKAYPISVLGNSLVVLIASGLKPIDASKLSESDAAKHIVIINTSGNVGTKVWPPQM